MVGKHHLENWFLWSPQPGHPQICKWQRAFADILEYHPAYENAPAFADAVDTVGDPRYFMCYQAYMHLLKVDPEFAAWHAGLDTPNACPHFRLTHPKLVKLTRHSRGRYATLPHELRWVVIGLGAVVLVLAAVWARLEFRPNRVAGDCRSVLTRWVAC